MKKRKKKTSPPYAVVELKMPEMHNNNLTNVTFSIPVVHIPVFSKRLDKKYVNVCRQAALTTHRTRTDAATKRLGKIILQLLNHIEKYQQ